MKKKLLAGLITGLLIICMVGMVEATPISVGVISGGNATYTELTAQLNDDSFFDFSATSITANLADSASELSQYDVVILGDSGYRDNGYTAAMFSAVRAYMESGGGVVTTGWYNFATDTYSGQMAIDADFITPINDTLGGYNYRTAPGTVNILSGQHAITSGITNFSFSGNHIEFETGVDLNATQLGSLVGYNSAVTIAYQDLIGRSVYLGGQYLASSSYNNSGLRLGIEDQLLEQAVAWAANGTEPIPEPTTMLLFGTGLAGFAGSRIRRKKRK